VEFYYENSNYLQSIGGCPILNTATDADDTNELLRIKVVNGIEFWQNNLKILLQAGIQNREFRNDIDVEKTAVSLIAMIQGAILIGNVSKNTVLTYTVLDTAKEYVNTLRT
jgi:hypothetical protein